MKDFGKLTVSILGCELVGILATPLTINSISMWYQYLHKPPFSPPNWLFGPVWTILYLLMGISLFLIRRRKQNTQSQIAIKWFLFQLVLNFLWSFIFFGAHQIALALLDIVILLFAIFMTIRKFEKLSVIAANLLVPYLLWVSFATILNFSLLLLNRG